MNVLNHFFFFLLYVTTMCCESEPENHPYVYASDLGESEWKKTIQLYDFNFYIIIVHNIPIICKKYNKIIILLYLFCFVYLRKT